MMLIIHKGRIAIQNFYQFDAQSEVTEIPIHTHFSTGRFLFHSFPHKTFMDGVVENYNNFKWIKKLKSLSHNFTCTDAISVGIEACGRLTGYYRTSITTTTVETELLDRTVFIFGPSSRAISYIRLELDHKEGQSLAETLDAVHDYTLSVLRTEWFAETSVEAFMKIVQMCADKENFTAHDIQTATETTFKQLRSLRTPMATEVNWLIPFEQPPSPPARRERTRTRARQTTKSFDEPTPQHTASDTTESVDAVAALLIPPKNHHAATIPKLEK